MKNEVIVQKSHRHTYDHAVRMVGVDLIEVVTHADLEFAISDRTAMLGFGVTLPSANFGARYGRDRARSRHSDLCRCGG